MYRTPRLAWKSYKDYPIKERMVSMVNIIKQEIVIEESLKKKKEKFLNLEKFLIYSIKKKLINLQNILTMKWKNLLKNFIQIKKKKTMTCHYKSLFLFIFSFLSFEFLQIQLIYLSFFCFDNLVLLYLIIVVNLLLKYHIHQI